MADDAVATASLDRLLHHTHVLSLKGDSYRMKDRMKIEVVDFQCFFAGNLKFHSDEILQFDSGVDTPEHRSFKDI
jgi:hypothetical protein